MTTDRLGAKDPRLADPKWLARMYAQHGDMWIALELGCNRKTVRKRREEFSIASERVGPRRGVTALPTVRQHADLAPVEQAVVARIQHERRRRVAPTEDLLIARIRAAHEARSAGDPNAYDDALLGISSAAALIYEHRQRLRAA